MKVNGEDISLSELKEPTLAALLAHFNLSKERVAIEQNQNIIKKKDYANNQLKEDDILEIIHFAGGG